MKITFFVTIILLYLNCATQSFYIAQEIEKSGLKITPSIFIAKGDQINLVSYFEFFNTNQLIIKPCVSGGS